MLRARAPLGKTKTNAIKATLISGPLFLSGWRSRGGVRDVEEHAPPSRGWAGGSMLRHSEQTTTGLQQGTGWLSCPTAAISCCRNMRALPKAG